MDKENFDRINEAAGRMTEAVRGSYEALAERAVAVGESNVRLAQNLFMDSIHALRAQAQSNIAVAETLAEQAQRQQEALQDVSLESVLAYSGFLDSMCSYYAGVMEDGEGPDE